METASQVRATAFSASLLMHIGAGALLLLAGYLFSQQPQTPLMAGDVFTVTAFEGPSAADALQPASIALVVVTPRQTVPVESAETQSPVATVVTRPTTVKPATTGLKTMSIDDFHKLHPQPARTGAKTQPSSNASTVTKVDIADVLSAGSGASSARGQTGATSAAGDADLMAAYEAILKQRLRSALIKPSLADEALAAQVNFRIAANGALSAVVIAKTSGDRAFDEALLAAFAKVKSIGPTPTGKAEALCVYFKLR